MVTVGVSLIAACVVAIVLGRLVPRLRVLALSAGAALIFLIGLVVWWGLLFLQVVRIDPLLAGLGVDRLEPPWIQLFLLGPPSMPALAFMLVIAGRWRTSDGLGA
jgi:hypothetical protein